MGVVDKPATATTGDRNENTAGSSMDVHFIPSLDIVSKLSSAMVGEVLYPGKT